MRLSDQQADLIWKLVEADKKVPGRRFVWIPLEFGAEHSNLGHPGFEGGTARIHISDLNALVDHGTLKEVSRRGDCAEFIVVAKDP